MPAVIENKGFDFEKIDIEVTEAAALAYNVAAEVFGDSPVKADGRKQKKICKWLFKSYIGEDGLPQKDFFSKFENDSELLEFMSECAKYTAERDALKSSNFEASVNEFSEDVRNAFLQLYTTFGSCDFTAEPNGEIILTFDDGGCYTRKLYLHRTVTDSDLKIDILYFSDAEILKQDKKYCLICEAGNSEADEQFKINIFFENATTQTQIYRADRNAFVLSPWNTLICIATDILSKKELADECFNAYERELLPLAEELSALNMFSTAERENGQSFSLLKEYFNKHNLRHLIPMLDKISKNFSNAYVWQILSARLQENLNKKECEPLWRELYGLISKSQNGYSDRMDLCDRDRLYKMRYEAEKKLRDLGYEGEYPSFVKKGTVKGIRLTESYGQAYFVGLGQRVEYRIYCDESAIYGEPELQLVCGALFGKTGNTDTDIYSCCFNSKGKSRFETVYVTPDYDLSLYTRIAAKKAECMSLDKAERKALGEGRLSLVYCLLTLIFTGGLFAAAMTAGMLLISCAVTAAVLGIGEIPNMISAMPWRFCFLFCFFGFGGSMAVIEFLEKRK